jgi:hypothetical protein
MAKTPHVELTPEEVRANWLAGYYTPAGYLYHLIRAMRKDGWWFAIDSVNDFCKTWGISRPSFYRAKAKLIEQGIIQERIVGRVDLRVVRSDEPDEPEALLEEYLSSESEKVETASCNFETVSCKSETTNCRSETASCTSETRTPLEVSQSNRSSNPTDLSQLFNNLSLKEDERERFEEFCLDQARSLPQLPTLIDRWIAKHIQSLYAKWQSFTASLLPAQIEDLYAGYSFTDRPPHLLTYYAT